MSLSSPADACTSSAGEVTRKPRLQRGFLPAQGRRAAVCAAEGCNKRAFLDPSTGNASSACKRLHTGVRLIGRGREFELCLLDPANEDSDSIKSQFNGGWKEAGNVPEVVRIFRVVMPDAIFELYNAYADRVGNKRRRFHGTARSPACDFLVTLQGSPCDERDCRTCSICTHGFQKTARPNPNWRFGEGIYSSSSSAKANNPYADGSELVHTDGKRYRSMFVCTVAAGYNVFKTQGGAAAAAPPSGTTAVVGDVGPILHHDELVVYENAAVLPTHIIVYTLD